jgi:hypothetical protein
MMPVGRLMSWDIEEVADQSVHRVVTLVTRRSSCHRSEGRSSGELRNAGTKGILSG